MRLPGPGGIENAEGDDFATDNGASFSDNIFDIPVAEIETIVEPDGVTDDVRRKSVTFIGIHPEILPSSPS